MKTFAFMIFILAFTLVILPFGGDQAFSQSVQFRIGTQYYAGTEASQLNGGITWLSKGDFTNDGWEDILVFNPQADSENITVMPNNGDGTLGDPIITPLAQAPADGVAGDFNEDGNLDVLGAITFPNDTGMAQIYFGQGNGTFTIGPMYAVARKFKLAAADFNRDSHTDMALTYAFQDYDYSYNVAVYFGDGTGGMNLSQDFVVPSGIFWGRVPATDIRASDLNADGFTDLVWLDNMPMAMLNDHTGRFDSVLVSTAWLMGYYMELGEFNGDSFPDVALVDGNWFPLAWNVKIGLGQGDGTFSFHDMYEEVLGKQSNSISVGDFDGDGILDVIAGNDYSDATLLRGSGDGNFLEYTRYQAGGMYLTPINLNTDEYMDLVSGGRLFATTVAATHGVAVGLNAPEVYPAKGFGLLVASGDINNDDYLDIVMGHKLTADLLSIFLGRAQGGFDTAFTVPVTREALALALGDLNRDGFDDLVVGSLPGQNGHLEVLLGSASGQLTHLSDMFNGSATVIWGRGLALADMNDDGTLDIISPTPTTLSVLPNNGDATFGTPLQSGWGMGTTSNILIDDYDGDNILDAVAVQDFNLNPDDVLSTIYLNHGHGNGAFNMVQQLSIDAGFPNAGQGFVDGDTLPDVLINGTRGTHSGLGGFYYLRNTGGSLALQFHDPTAPGGDLEVADFNGDGRIEAVTSTSLGGLQVQVNNGSGAFDTLLSLPSPEAPYDLLAGNFIGTTLPDLAVLNSYRNPSSVVLYENITQFPVEVDDILGSLPERFILYQNYPNPFNPSTTIKYSLPEPGKITLILYDILGNEIAVLEEGFKERGNYNISFNASDLASGIYLYRLQHSKGFITQKMLLLK